MMQVTYDYMKPSELTKIKEQRQKFYKEIKPSFCYPPSLNKLE